MITEVKLAEVIDINTDTNIIVVRTISDNIPRTYDSVRPIDLNLLKVPVVGEHVTIIKGLRQESNLSVRRYDWYYATTYSIQSNINNNLLPGVTAVANLPVTFNDIQVDSLQLYKGDIAYQGRWGNTIRLGSSVNESVYTFRQNWTSNQRNSPIIIISNNTANTKVESVDSANSCIWLTSDQKLSNFTTNHKIQRTDTFNSQLIGSADRVVLKAKTDVVALDSNVAIEINAPRIQFGVDANKEPTLHSTAILKALNDIIGILKAGTIAGGPLILANKLLDVERTLEQAANLSIWQDKYKQQEL
jgi:hypothetical protein